MGSTRKTFGDTLRAVRLRLQLNQDDLARRMGMQRMAVSRWETELRQPRKAHLDKLIKAVAAVDANAAREVANAAGYAVALPTQEPSAATIAVQSRSVLCAASEAADVSPVAIKKALLAAIAELRAQGLSLADLERALSASRDVARG